MPRASRVSSLMYSSPPNCERAAASFVGIHSRSDIIGSLPLDVEAKLRIKLRILLASVK